MTYYMRLAHASAGRQAPSFKEAVSRTASAACEDVAVDTVKDLQARRTQRVRVDSTIKAADAQAAQDMVAALSEARLNEALAAVGLPPATILNLTQAAVEAAPSPTPAPSFQVSQNSKLGESDPTRILDHARLSTHTAYHDVRLAPWSALPLPVSAFWHAGRLLASKLPSAKALLRPWTWKQ